MILDEINATIEFNIEGRVLDGTKMPVENNFIIQNNDNFVLNGKNFELVYKQQGVTIDEYLSVGTSHICHIINSDDKGNILARLIFFGGKLLTLNEVHVLVDPSTKLFKENFNSIIKNSLFEINGESYFIIKASCAESEDSVTGADFAFSIITAEKNVDEPNSCSIDVSLFNEMNNLFGVFRIELVCELIRIYDVVIIPGSASSTEQILASDLQRTYFFCYRDTVIFIEKSG